jgi:hypothetical protein
MEIRLLLLFLIALSFSGAVEGVVFQDGSVHEISYLIDGGVMVDRYDAYGIGTTVNLVTGAHITGPLSVGCDGHVNVHDANIAGSLSALGHSRVTLSGGTIGGDLFSFGAAEVLYMGGQVEGRLEIYYGASITIAGSDFFINEAPIAPGQYYSHDLGYLRRATLSGKLASGESFSNQIYFNDYYRPKLILIPEPTTLLLLGLGGLALLRNRKT